MLTTSCSVSPATKIVDTSCTSFSLILLSKKEIPILTAETKRQILTHNLVYEQKCLPPKSGKQPE
ncbi:Rz-like spanin [Pantoea phage vB_PagM_SSEM1]|uniref:Uncharacterized protein n=1 Tax=Pantoea phage vB_PagM_SSEM1 TaxID=2721760 RepID=A0A6H0D9I2_9CAUD|nr:Rz-like spanin [Pantoea phage vB_PagM_SSEM1]QIS79366.1 hypothetical protein SSEM1_gp45 [Pantoea phage vB_PagM_SSEM1]